MTETTLTIGDTSADTALKQKHAAMWASGHYEAVATDLIAELGPVLVEATGIHEAALSSTSRPAPATSPSPPRSPAPG